MHGVVSRVRRSHSGQKAVRIEVHAFEAIGATSDEHLSVYIAVIQIRRIVQTAAEDVIPDLCSYCGQEASLVPDQGLDTRSKPLLNQRSGTCNEA